MHLGKNLTIAIFAELESHAYNNSKIVHIVHKYEDMERTYLSIVLQVFSEIERSYSSVLLAPKSAIGYGTHTSNNRMGELGINFQPHGLD